MADNQTNRNIANEELRSTFEGDLKPLDVSTPEIDATAIIPQEQTDSSLSQTSNNFNVNVNINGDGRSPSSAVRTGTETIINNVLNTTPSLDPLEIKKNYSVNLPDGGEGDASLFGDSPVMDHIGHSYMDTDGIELPGLGVSEMSFDLPSLSNYTYSLAKVKTENKTVQHRYEFIKNIINKAMGEVSLNEPRQAVKNEQFVQSMSDVRNFINEQNITTMSGDTNVDLIEKVTREYHQNTQRLQYESDKATIEMRRGVDRQRSEGMALGQELSNITPTDHTDYSPTIPDQKDDLSFRHINNISTNFGFANEINRPPVWRSVLG